MKEVFTTLMTAERATSADRPEMPSAPAKSGSNVPV